MITKIGWKIVGGLPASLAAGLARKAVTRAWSRATGAAVPADPQDPRTPLGQAVAWSVVSGAGVGLVHLAVTRRAARTWRRATGELPPGMVVGPAPRVGPGSSTS